MPVFNNALAGAAGSGGAAAYKITRSLRFNDDDQAYLSKNIGSVGDQRRMTFSFWVKRHSISSSSGFAIFAQDYLTSPSNAVVDRSLSMLFDGDRLELYDYGASSDSGNNGSVQAWTAGVVQEGSDNVLFRDPSAWYHIVFAIDTTQSTPADRCKVWINGVQRTMSGYPVQNSYLSWGQARQHYIGIQKTNGSFTRAGDFSLADVHFIDGQQLSNTDFGEFDATTGVWNPIEFSHNVGGTNYDSLLTVPGGFASGEGADNAFDGSTSTRAKASTPDDIITFDLSSLNLTGSFEFWATNASSEYSLDGGTTWTSSLSSNYTTATSDISGVSNIKFKPSSGTTMKVTAFRNQGNVLVSATPSVSFHLDFSDNSSNAALGTDSSGNSNTWTVNNLFVNVEGAETSAISSISGNTLTFTDSTNLDKFSAGDVIQEVSDAPRSGYSSSQVPTNPENAVDGDINTHTIFSSPSGSASDWYEWTLPYARSYTTLQVVMSGSAASGNDVYIGASNGTVTQATNQFEGSLTSTATAYTLTGMPNPVKSFSLFLAGGGYSPTFKLHGLIIDGSYVKTVTAASVSAANNQIVSEAGGDWATGRTAVRPAVEGDDIIDSPSNYEASSGNGGNYATLNPLATVSGLTLSNGNLDATGNAVQGCSLSTIFPSSGKYYAEFTLNTYHADTAVGVVSTDVDYNQDWVGEQAYTVGYLADGRLFQNSSATNIGAYAAGDIIGIAFDVDTGKIWFSKNGTFINSGDPGAGTGELKTITGGKPLGIAFRGVGAGAGSFNFGQRPFSISSVPTGFKSLCTQNLDDPLVADGSAAMDVTTWTGNGSTQTISGLEFSPDLVWIKSRSNSSEHVLVDAIRGSTNVLSSNAISSEYTISDGVTSLNADGFSLGADSFYAYVNDSSRTYVGWTWDAGSSNTSISVGSANSSVYNTSSTWRNNWTASGNGFGSNPVSKIFDANLDNYMNNDAGGQYITWNTTSYTLSGELLIDVSSSSGVYDIYVNGSKAADTSSSRGWVNCGTFADINEIQFAGTSYGTSDGLGNAGVNVYGIKVGGKQLIDSDVTPPSVPSIASTVRANPTAGFSIVSYTGTGSTATIGHGLNAAPGFIFIKSRTNSDGWPVYHQSLSNPANNFLTLHNNNPVGSITNYWNGTNSSVIGTLGGYGHSTSGEDYIAYCFAPVEGYSAFGSYTGNGSADGPFVYTGFKTRWLMIKSSSHSGEDWLILDTARDTHNDGDSSALYASLSHADNSTSAITTDILSNGFKCIGTNAATNASGYTYIYAAFAENPFKTARAR